MKTIGISEARKNIADYFKDAIYKNELIVLSRYDKEKAFLLGEKTIEYLIKTNLSPVRFETIQEEDESYTIKLDSLDGFLDSKKDLSLIALKAFIKLSAP